MSAYVIALYIRLSIEDVKYESMSIENQKLALHEYADAMPEVGHAEILEFVDNGYTGTNFERPEVQRMIELVRQNRIDCIIVKDFSRFGRNSIETGYFLEKVFPLFHTRFISVSDDYDSANFRGDTGGMNVAFKYLINEYYSRDMSMKTRSAKYAKMERGEYQSKICPYGYRKGANGRMEPDGEAAETVKLIFSLAADGQSATEIARELHRRGIPTPGEYKAAHGNHTHDISRTKGVWAISTILRILDNEVYTGDYIIRRREVKEIGGNRSVMRDRSQWIVIPDFHEPLIDKETFKKANEAINHYHLGKKNEYTYPLKGRAFCGCCRHALTRHNQNNPEYICRRSACLDDAPCRNLKIPVPELENLVLRSIRERIGQNGEDGSSDDIAESGTGETRTDSLEQERLALYEAYLNGDISLDVFKEQKERIAGKILTAQKSRALLAEQSAKENTANELKRLREEIASADCLTVEMCERLIDRVFVYPNKRIEVEFK